ncbi:HTTM domain-containing protein [Gynurincola endophyticus]|uniref:HTTM domain-containing protein n=1 Tax=Gynurincola endophyticus TaxID=2479004 RepID=UPI000F8C3694|nr:HTTM domain-containing protein [Gynurincola endophyticus]
MQFVKPVKNAMLHLQDFFTQKNTHTQLEFLTFFRVSISAIAIIDVCSMFSDFHLFFSKSDTIIPQEITFVFSSYFGYLHEFYKWLNSNNYTGIFYNYALWIYLSMLFLLMIGLFTRFSAFMALIAQIVIFKSFDDYNYGYDTFLTISLFYCFIFPVGRAFSIDHLIKKRPVSPFNYARILQLHLCIVYVFAGLPKLLDSSWWTGKSMWKALVSVYNDYQTFPAYFFLLAGITTILIEVFYPVLMYIKHTRLIALVMIILMHIGIAILMHLFIFAAIMIALNIAAWYHLLPSKNPTPLLNTETAC